MSFVGAHEALEGLGSLFGHLIMDRIERQGRRRDDPRLPRRHSAACAAHEGSRDASRGAVKEGGEQLRQRRAQTPRVCDEEVAHTAERTLTYLGGGLVQGAVLSAAQRRERRCEMRFPQRRIGRQTEDHPLETKQRLARLHVRTARIARWRVARSGAVPSTVERRAERREQLRRGGVPVGQVDRLEVTKLEGSARELQPRGAERRDGRRRVAQEELLEVDEPGRRADERIDARVCHCRAEAEFRQCAHPAARRRRRDRSGAHVAHVVAIRGEGFESRRSLAACERAHERVEASVG